MQDCNGERMCCDYEVAKAHSLSVPSTCVDELIELHESSTDILGLRNTMATLGMYQQDATKVYQDNKSAIQIANHREASGQHPEQST